MPVMILVMNGATLAIIWFGGRMVSTGALGAGELISFISYVFQILFSVMMISMVILMSARAQASGKRLVEVLDAEIDIVEKPVTAQPSIYAGKVEFRDVSFKYDRAGSGDDVLCDVSLTIQPGQVVGVVGGTGVGKTTLVHLIPRLYDVTAGAVLVDDVDVRDYPLESLREQIGMVLQKNTLFSGTIRDNLLWGNRSATQQEIETACRDAQAHDFIMSFPNGYDTELGQGGVNLSGGQKQRLCIARAILKKPKILILDDSTSAVDSGTEERIREAFYRTLAHTSVLIIAQRISSVRDADKIIVLDDGRVAGVGTHQELLASNHIYQEINASQQEGVLSLG
jgi:ATP-binding cassette subfamily B protein